MVGKYLFKSKKFINDKALEESSSFIFNKNNLLLSIYATIGKLCINKIDLALPQSILGVKFIKEIDLEYGYYLFYKNNNKFISMQQIGSQPNISLDIVKNIKLMCTQNFKEQQKIAKFFTLLDIQIELWERKLQLNELMKQYYLNQLFIHSMKCGRVPKLRFREFNGEWKKMNFQEIFKVENISKYYQNSSELSGCTPIYDQSDEIIAGYSDAIEFYKTNFSILFGDHTRIFKKIIGNALFKGDGVRVIKSLIINNEYLFYFLISTKIENLGYSRHFKLLKEIIFYVSSSLEQEKISKFFSLLDKISNKITMNINNLIKIKKYYLHNLFI